MTESLSPPPVPPPTVRFTSVQPPPQSMLSIPSAAHTVVPEELPAPSAQTPPKRGARRKLWYFAALASVIGVVSAGAVKQNTHISPAVHSGSPGFRTSKSGKTQHWQKKSVKIYIDDSISKIGAGEAVMASFGRWVESDPRLPDVGFDTTKGSVKPAYDGKSTVSYGPITVAGHERDLAITMTYSDDRSGEIVEADIVLNSMYPLGILQANEKNWHWRDGKASGTEADDDDKSAKASDDKNIGDDAESAKTKGDDDKNAKAGDDDDGDKNIGTNAESAKTKGNDDKSNNASGTENTKTSSKSMVADESENCSDRYDVQNVVTHEAGHFFGLGEDPTERGSTMFQTIDQCETHKRALAPADVSALTALYAAHEDPDEAAAGPRCNTAAAPANTSVAGWLSAVVLGVLVARRRRSG